MSLMETFYNEEQKIWSGPENTLFTDPQISIGKVIYEVLKEKPNNKFQIVHDDGKILTNADALTATVSIARYLKSEGLTHRDVVGLIARNTTHVAHVLFACLFNATPFHAVNPMLEREAIASLYAITKPKIIFCDGRDYEFLKLITKDWTAQLITLSEHIENATGIEEILATAINENNYEPTKLVHGADQTMAIVCSSGTSGLPKAVTITNSQLLLISPVSGLNDVVYTTASYDWLSAIKSLLSSTVNEADRVICSQPFSVELLVEIVKKWQVTYLYVSHWQFNALFSSPLATAENLSSLQFVQYSGGWVSAGVVQAARRIIESTIFVYAYGTTETDGISACLNPETENLVGSLLPGVHAQIVNDAGVPLAHDEVGEILIKTNQKWNGYYGNPVQTAQTLDSQGWFHMGDMGYFDKENRLYMVDRKKDLLKYQSMHYTPNEIEKIIIELPDVQEVCVVGMKDPLYGDAAGALIVRKPQSLLSEKQVIDYVAKRISVQYKQLHAGVCFVDKLPINFNGKMLRNEARELFNSTKMRKAKL
ncbi:PREDICTED: 4-coumarate--CoA ligase 1-like [Drosophila arizonae]|uniref:4-coumarate--CoA ligase 1-like n=1 Tax=Drosophila arizonae TaxID=7263 RepID=A0ABM1PBN7_DROAR|nr:PREDICTED: 4-coumarate--CoA ligase 1-like [Drosophila arizonae]